MGLNSNSFLCANEFFDATNDCVDVSKGNNWNDHQKNYGRKSNDEFYIVFDVFGYFFQTFNYLFFYNLKGLFVKFVFGGRKSDLLPGYIEGPVIILHRSFSQNNMFIVWLLEIQNAFIVIFVCLFLAFLHQVFGVHHNFSLFQFNNHITALKVERFFHVVTVHIIHVQFGIFALNIVVILNFVDQLLKNIGRQHDIRCWKRENGRLFERAENQGFSWVFQCHSLQFRVRQLFSVFVQSNRLKTDLP